MNEEKMTLKESVRLTLRAWRFYWKNTPRFVLSTVLWALADAVSPYAVVWFSARLVAELSDARDPQALAVDVAWVLGVTALLTLVRSVLLHWKSVEREQLNWQLEQLNLKQSELSELEEQLKVLDADRKMSEEDMQAIDISMNAITEMTARIHGSFGLQLADYISQLFSYISNGAHKKLNIDEKFQVTVDDDRKLLQPQQLSAGTVDQIYFSVRMAVSQMLYDEPMPLILDDSFVLYDDERLKNTLRWLTEQKAFSQILIFTCHHREAEMLESLNCDYHYVEL